MVMVLWFNVILQQWEANPAHVAKIVEVIGWSHLESEPVTAESCWDPYRRVVSSNRPVLWVNKGQLL